MTVVTQRYTFSGTGEDFGPRKGRFLVILHTFENTDPLKNTMRDAVAGAIWQDRNDVLGSYNRLVAVDGVLGCVPDDRSSGGVNPASSYFKPLPWLSGMLPAYVVSDPNAYALQLCAMGRRDYYDANGWPPSIIDGFARSILEEEAASGNDMVVSNHADWQPGNRSDAGAIALDLVMKRYDELLRQPEEDMPLVNFTPIVNRRATIAKGAAARSQPAFDRNDYDAGLIATEPNQRTRTAVAWVDGTNLTLRDGSVYDARKRWLLTDSDSHGAIFYHERDVVDFQVIEGVDCAGIMAELESTKQQIEVQSGILADTKTQLATATSKISAAKAALG